MNIGQFSFPLDQMNSEIVGLGNDFELLPHVKTEIGDESPVSNSVPRSPQEFDDMLLSNIEIQCPVDPNLPSMLNLSDSDQLKLFYCQLPLLSEQQGDFPTISFDSLNSALSYSPSSTSSGEEKFVAMRNPSKKRSREESEFTMSGIDPDAFLAMESPMKLTRDQLLNLSSEEIDNIAKSLLNNGSLTETEQKQLKKQRRLIRNRESAQLSRIRKKQYIQNLEKRVNEMSKLIEDNNVLTEENRKLFEENRALKERLARFESETRNAMPDQGRNSTRMANAGVLMLVVLFSFGLFVNMPTGQRSNMALTGRILQEVADSSIPSIAKVVNSEPALLAEVVASHSAAENRRILLSEEKSQLPLPLPLVERAAKSPRLSVVEESIIGKPLFAHNHKDDKSQLVAIEESVPVRRQLRTEGQYLYCSNPEKVLRDTIAKRNPEGHLTFNLLIPSHALNGTVPNVDQLDKDTLLDISCRIQDISIHPFVIGGYGLTNFG